MSERPERKVQEQEVKLTVPEMAGAGKLVSCTLCGSNSAWVFRGLATLGIEYEGDETKFICDTCIAKIKRA